MNKEATQQFKGTGNSRYHNESHKACFNTSYGDFKDLQGITFYNKSMHEAAFNVPNNIQYDKYQQGLTLIIYKFLNGKSK